MDPRAKKKPVNEEHEYDEDWLKEWDEDEYDEDSYPDNDEDDFN